MDNDLTAILIVFDKDNQGPVILYEELVGENYPCKFIYFLCDNNDNRTALAKFINDLEISFIGFSFASHSTKTAFDLAQYLKGEFPDTPLIFGGIHPTIDPLSCMDYCNAVCIGEADDAIVEIASRIKKQEDYLQSRNLIYKKDGQIVRNHVNPLVSNLDNLPIRRPYTSDHGIIERGKVIPVNLNKYFDIIPELECGYMQVFSRGCPYSCTYCCNSAFFQLYPEWPRVRSKTVTAVIDEICENIKLNPKIVRVFIIDDCFLVHDLGWLRDFVRLWNQKVRKDLGFFSIPQYITQDKLDILKDINICCIDLGLQSGSTRINKIYGRAFSKERFLKACRLIQSSGISLSVDIIFDSPWEEEADYFDTLDILTSISKPFLIQQYSLKIYPGTKLYERCHKEAGMARDFNMSYQNYNCLQGTEINYILILTQILPRNFTLYLFKNRHNLLVKIITKIMYTFGCVLLLPFLGVFVVGPKGLKQKIALAVSFRRVGVSWLKDLLGIRR